MATHASVTELRKMSVQDLRIELRDAQIHLAKLRLGVKLQKEKNTMKYIREKKHFARLTMVLNEKMSDVLQTEEVQTKVATPKKKLSTKKKS